MILGSLDFFICIDQSKAATFLPISYLKSLKSYYYYVNLELIRMKFQFATNVLIEKTRFRTLSQLHLTTRLEVPADTFCFISGSLPNTLFYKGESQINPYGTTNCVSRDSFRAPSAQTRTTGMKRSHQGVSNTQLFVSKIR